MRDEYKNYYRCCLRPSFALKASLSFLYHLFFAVAHRTAPSRLLFPLPKDVRKVQKKLLAAPVPKVEIQPVDRISPGKIRLTLDWLHFEKRPDWSATFPDPENTVSLHRWNWLLLGITEQAATISHEQGLALMRSWLNDRLQDESLGVDAYSTGERIVNGSLFLLLGGDGKIPLDIQAAFRRMGHQIARNLEYYKGDLTGNHAFNNARGLLFAGAATDLPDAVDLAFVIARERLPRLATKDGFLREGSSHYHFLFTRWVLEMVWIAKRNGYSDFYLFLEPYARKLIERCWFFLVKSRANGWWHIPMIGDISPDFTPSWLLGLPWSRLATDVFCPDVHSGPPGAHGWAALFGIDKDAGYLTASEQLTFPESFWHRIEYGAITLFIYAAADNGKPSATHRHFDLGGFVLFMAGDPVLIDCGRLDYTPTEIGNYGKGAYAHNTIFVNGLPPAADGPSWFLSTYRAVKVSTRFYQTDDSTVFTVRHDGFSRFAGPRIEHERRFILRHRSFAVEDQLTGTKQCNILLRFHWAPGLALTQDGEYGWDINISKWRFHQDKQLRAKMLVGQDGTNAGGLYFPEYGISQECRTLELESNLAVPVTITNSLNFSD